MGCSFESERCRDSQKRFSVGSSGHLCAYLRRIARLAEAEFRTIKFGKNPYLVEGRLTVHYDGNRVEASKLWPLRFNSIARKLRGGQRCRGGKHLSRSPGPD